MTIEEYVAYWQATAEKRLRFHPDDQERMAGIQDPRSARRLPEPWFGKPTQAKIFVLSSHPNMRPNSAEDPEIILPWRRFCREMMCERVSMKDLCRLNFSYMKERWQRTSGEFGKFTLSYICELRFVPYASSSKQALGKIGTGQNPLESSKRARDLVHKHLLPKARNGEILLLVMASPVAWEFDSVENDEWRYNSHLFISRPGIRNWSIATDRCSLGRRVTEKLTERAEA